MRGRLSETFSPPSACTDRGCTRTIQPAAVSEPDTLSSINSKAPSSSSQSHDTSVDTPGLPVHTWTSCAWEDLISDQLTAGSGPLIVDFYYVWWVKGLWFIWYRCSVVNVPHVLYINDVPYSARWFNELQVRVSLWLSSQADGWIHLNKQLFISFICIR